MSFLPADIDKLNEDVKEWTHRTYKDVISEMDKLNIKHADYSRSPQSLQKALTTKIRKRDGIADRISFQFPRHGVFVHKGVSRGHGKDNPRTAKPFLNPPVEKNFDDLAYKYLDATGNLIINALAVK